MLTKLSGGKVYDPANGINGDVGDIFLRDGCIAAPLAHAWQTLLRCAASRFTALVISHDICHGFA